MATQYARVETKRVPMHDPICAAKVAEHVATFRVQPFSTDQAATMIEIACGRFTRGAHAGQLRGWAEIEVVTAGGWLKRNGRGSVAYPNTILSVRIADYSGKLYLEA